MTRSAWNLATPRDVDWRVSAACGPDTADWFWLMRDRKGPPKLSVANRLALRLCQTCPVIAECARFEAEHPQPYTRIAGGKVIVA